MATVVVLGSDVSAAKQVRSTHIMYGQEERRAA